MRLNFDIYFAFVVLNRMFGKIRAKICLINLYDFLAKIRLLIQRIFLQNLGQNTLNHLAIIMDGNGRWAKNRALPRTDGHKEGAKVVRSITKWCAKHQIRYISLYAFSTENWLRPKKEVDFLMKLLTKYLEREESTYLQNNIKFKAIGDISAFSPNLRDLIQSLEAKTAQNTALTQILALNYGAKDEVARAILKILHSRRESNEFIGDLRKSKSEILDEFESALDTADIPPVDLLIRTGGEMRLSNFLLYQCAYAELYFSKTLFPDFDTAELKAIIAEFKTRHRRFGEV